MARLTDRIAVLAASTLAELRASAARVARAPGSVPWPGCGVRGGPWRLAVVALDRQRLSRELARFAAKGAAPGALACQVSTEPRVAMLFTGQGAQYPGMGAPLYRVAAPYRAALDRCADVLRPRLALLDAVCGAMTADGLRQTAVTQPALFAVEYAAAAMWASWGVRGYAMLGHSVGEYAAACAAGCAEPEPVLGLVHTRGQLMQSLPGDGAMLTVLGSPSAVRGVADALPDISVAAVNGPHNVVLSGPAAAIATAAAKLRGQGLLTKQLTVSHAFHSCLMDPVLDDFERAAAQVRFGPPRAHLICNVTGIALAAGAELPAGYWRRHLREPVLFAQGVRTLSELGCDVSLEVGPRPALTAMARKCLPRGTMTWLATQRRDADPVTQLLQAAAAMYAHGTDIDWQAMHADLDLG